MSEFDEYFADGFDDLTRTMGETVVYRPRSGGSRTLTGIVNRDPPQVLTSAGDYVLPTLTVTVHANVLTGILASEIDAGDKIDVAIKPGATRESRTIFSITSFDGGVTTLSVR